MSMGNIEQSSIDYQKYKVDLHECDQHLHAYLTSIKPRMEREGLRAFEDLFFLEEAEKVLTFLLKIYEEVNTDKKKKEVFFRKEPRIMKASFRMEILKYMNMLKENKNNALIKKIDFLAYEAKRNSDEFERGCGFIHHRFSCFTFRKNDLQPRDLQEIYHQKADVIDKLVRLYEIKKIYYTKKYS